MKYISLLLASVHGFVYNSKHSKLPNWHFNVYLSKLKGNIFSGRLHERL